MNNFPVKIKGREYWISRSIAVVGLIIGIDYNGTEHILAVQRGTGTPDPEFVGKWCLPCGYLDYNETCKQAVAREAREETGINIHAENFELIYIDDNPYNDKRQNVVFTFVAGFESYIEDEELTNRFSEANEVMDILWIPISWINNYKWAFNHEKIIKEYFQKEKVEATVDR